MTYEVGQIHEMWTPFIVEDRDIPLEDGFGTHTIKSWRPGVRNAPVEPDEFEPVWDGEGLEIRRIVAVVKIDGGGVRILYRRTWRRPDGVEFGKAKVRMTTPSAFTSWKRRNNSGLDEILRREAA